MSRDSDPSIPPALRDRLQDEDAEERADLEAVWALLGQADPAPDEAPDLDEEWAALRRRRPDVASESDPNAFSQNGQAPPSETGPRARTARRPRRPDQSQRWGRWVGAFAVVLMMA